MQAFLIVQRFVLTNLKMKYFNYYSIFIIVAFIYSENEHINSGPMVGYSTKREVALWIQTKDSKNVRFNYWEKNNSQCEKVI